MLRVFHICVFKEIKVYPLLFLQSFEAGGADDEELEPCVETKDCIQDVIEITSEFACSAQMTEVYIPVPDCLLPGDDKLFHVKDESEDPLSEGNSPVPLMSDPAAITSDAVDPLATDDLPNTLTASQDEKVEAQGRGAMVADLDWTNGLLSSSSSSVVVIVFGYYLEPTLSEDGDPFESSTTAHESAFGFIENVNMELGQMRAKIGFAFGPF
ncbi:uncharacterized protein LOC124172095 [Ischnura elegans]|uniref:uncharacterized protein LOC124172095 n=1 Tax=Ischnura elegans TaxID=197161 RepID=UPI001ED86CC7|nr:uncharacterized protein LOC124172095 [Ischnura elegans]